MPQYYCNYPFLLSFIAGLDWISETINFTSVSLLSKTGWSPKSMIIPPLIKGGRGNLPLDENNKVKMPSKQKPFLNKSVVVF